MKFIFSAFLLKKGLAKFIKSLTYCALPVVMLPILVSWGVFGHERINHAAVLALPGELRIFFYNHIDFITQESSVPDLRKYTLGDKSEYPRHFIDLENFQPWDSLPKTIEELNKKYSQEFLSRNGTLPWHIRQMTEKLSQAFREKRKTEILFLAADLGHYLADAHMPLHTTVNHDGQLTGQTGIHSFWESQLPDLFGNDYDCRTAQATYIKNIHAEIWSIMFSSHKLVDTLLLVEKTLKDNYPADQIYLVGSDGTISKNKFNKPIHSHAYSKKYHEALHGMVESQMKKAVSATANFWFTAWVNAGMPDLKDLDPPALTKRNALLLKEELEMLKIGKFIDLKSEKEF